jgi:carbamoyl-phosphate synthase large subunit
MKRRVLVTAIGGDVGHSILKCINKNENYILGCDIVEFPSGLDLVEEFFRVINAESDKYIEKLVDLCKKNSVTHLIPTNEIEIKRISERIEDFKFLKVLINHREIVVVFLDKFKTNLFLLSNGFNVPRSFSTKDEIEKGVYILKLNNSNGSKVLKIFKDKSEINELINSSQDEFIIQEYIPDENSEYTVGVFSDGVSTNVITFRRLLNGGYTKFVELVHDRSIENEATKLASKLNLVGSLNIQLRKHNGKNYIFEINPRLSGTTNFRKQLGFDEVNWWLKTSDGSHVSNYRCLYKKAIGVREMNEKFLIIEKI